MPDVVDLLTQEQRIRLEAIAQANVTLQNLVYAMTATDAIAAVADGAEVYYQYISEGKTSESRGAGTGEA